MLARFRARRATLLVAFAFTLCTIFAINFFATGSYDTSSSTYSWPSLSAYLPSVSDGEGTLRPDCAVASKDDEENDDEEDVTRTHPGDPPFVKLDDLLASANSARLARQRRPARGCPPPSTGRLCRLEDVFDEIIVISLPRATDRLARVRAQLRALGVPYTLVHAVDGRLMGGSAELAKLVMADQRDQHPGVFSLFLTHLGLMEYVARSPGLERVLLLEDDVILCADFPRAFDTRVRRIPDDWRLLWLGGVVDWTSRYKNAEALDHFVDVGFARPVTLWSSWAVGIHREAAAVIGPTMVAARGAIDQKAYQECIAKWPDQTVLMWPPVAMTNPYHGSLLGHNWGIPPAVWARNNGLDMAHYDLARGYHTGGELGADVRCVVDRNDAGGSDDDYGAWEYPKAQIAGRAVTASAAECCARCSAYFPQCQAWLWYPPLATNSAHRNSTCVMAFDPAARVPSAPRNDSSGLVDVAVSGRLVQEDSVPRVPNVVHFVSPRTTTTKPRPVDVWTYLAVLSAAVNAEPDEIRWHHGGGGGGGHLLEGAWWECTRQLVVPLERIFNEGADLIDDAHRADAAGIEVLIEEGGVYLNTDALVLRSFEPLRAREVVTLATDGFNSSALGVVVAPAGAAFLRRWWAAYQAGFDRNSSNALEHHKWLGELTRRMAKELPGEARLLSHAAFYPRSYAPAQLKVAYEADDCARGLEAESFTVYRYSAEAQATAATEAERRLNDWPPADELEAVWMGKGSLHRVARAVLRKALARGQLCAVAEKEVRRLAARRDTPTCPP